jgi:hypothetical protein
MIVEFQPNNILLCCPPLWWLDYKQDNDVNFKRIAVSYDQLKTFLELYGYATNDILELTKFGVNVKNIKHCRELK